MKKLKFFALFLSLIVIVVILMSFRNGYILYPDQMVALDNKCGCQSSSKDSFEKPLRYTHGEFKGLCINSCKYRVPEIISPLGSKNKLKVSNLFHNESFWTAEIPLKSVKGVDIIFETFAPGINHVSMLFHFVKKNQILLIDQSQNSKKLLIDSLLVSPEAAPPEQKKYDLIDGFLGRYAFMNRLMSETQYRQMTVELKHPVRTYKTQLNSQEAQLLLTLALQDANNVFERPYQLIFNNCATSVIDYSLQAKKSLRSKDWDIWDILDPLRGIPTSISLGTIRTLQWWEIIDLAQSSTERK